MAQAIDAQLKEVLHCYPWISMAILFGSVATGSARAESDLDIALAGNQRLTTDEKIVSLVILPRRLDDRLV